MKRIILLALALSAQTASAASVHFVQTGATHESRTMPTQESLVAAATNYYGKQEWLEKPAEIWSKDPRAASTARFLSAGKQLNTDGRVKKVFYPFGRSDVARVFQAFTGPKGAPEDVWLVDGLPFGRPMDVGQAFASGHGKLTYFTGHRNADMSAETDRVVYEIDGEHGKDSRRVSGVGAGLLWELERLGASKISVTYLDAEGKPLSSKEVHDVSELGSWSLSKPGVVPIVRMRFTLAGKTRKVTYVQHEVGKAPLPPALRRFFRAGYDAMFEKASGWPGMLHKTDLLPFRNAALRGLNAGHGKVFTDDPVWMEKVATKELPLVATATLTLGTQTYRNGESYVLKKPLIKRTRLVAAASKAGARRR